MLTRREQTGRLLGAFVAVSVGVTLVMLSTLLLASARPVVPERFSAAPIVVQSPDAKTSVETFAQTRPWSSRAATDLADRLAALPGVAAAVPDRTFYAQPVVHGRPDAATTQGHGWASAQLAGLRLTAGRPPIRETDVVLDRALGLPVGSRATILTATGPSSYTISGLTNGPGVHVADRLASRLAPGVRAIGLILPPDSDAERVADAAADVVAVDGTVLRGDDRSALEPRDDARTRWIGMQILTGVAALAGFVTVFVVASTFAFTVNQRRRELALLRLIGATPRQLRRLLYREALLVGTAAALTGVCLGATLAPAVAELLVEAGIEPTTYTIRPVAWPVAASFLIGPAVALIGVWTAARRGAKVRPVEALREATTETRTMSRSRWAVGAVLGAIGIALAVGTATAHDARDGGTFALYSAMALITAAAVLAPAVIPPLAALLSWPFARRRGAVGMLVRESARTGARRTAGCAAPVLLTIGFAVMISGMVQSSTAAYATQRAGALAVGWVVTPDRTPGLTDAVVAGTPGAALLPTTVYAADGSPIDAVGLDPHAYVDASSRPDRLSGPLAHLNGTSAVLNETTARTLNRHAGADFPITFADGEPARLQIVAILPDAVAPAAMILPRTVVRAHDPSALTEAVLTHTPSAPPTASGARVIDAGTYAAETDRENDRLVWIFTMLLIVVSSGYGAIAVTNTLLMAAGGRLADYRVLRLTGATNRQVTGTAAAESAFVVITGALLGGAVSTIALLGIRRGLSEQVHAPVDLVVPWPTIAMITAVCGVVAVAAGVLPTRRRRLDRRQLM